MLKTCSAMEILKKHGGVPHKAMGGILNSAYAGNKMAALPKKAMYKKGGQCKAMGGAAKARKDFPNT